MCAELFWGVDDGNIRGATRFHAMISMVLIVHPSFAKLLLRSATGRNFGQARLGPIQKALAQRPAA